jgi:hypothetical protein
VLRKDARWLPLSEVDDRPKPHRPTTPLLRSSNSSQPRARGASQGARPRGQTARPRSPKSSVSTREPRRYWVRSAIGCGPITRAQVACARSEPDGVHNSLSPPGEPPRSVVPPLPSLFPAQGALLRAGQTTRRYTERFQPRSSVAGRFQARGPRERTKTERDLLCRGHRCATRLLAIQPSGASRARGDSAGGPPRTGLFSYRPIAGLIAR